MKTKKIKLSERAQRLREYGVDENLLIEEETARPSYGSMFTEGASLEKMRKEMESGKYSEDEIIKKLGTRGLRVITEGNGWRPYDSVKNTYMANDKWKFTTIDESGKNMHCFVKRSYTQRNGGIHYESDYPRQDQIFWAKEKGRNDFGIFRITEITGIRDSGVPCVSMSVDKIGSHRTREAAEKDSRVDKEIYNSASEMSYFAKLSGNGAMRQVKPPAT